MKKVIVLCVLVFMGIGIKDVEANNNKEVCASLSIPIEGWPHLKIGRVSTFSIPNLGSNYYVEWSVSSEDFEIVSTGDHSVKILAEKKASGMLTATVISAQDGSFIYADYLHIDAEKNPIDTQY